MLSLRIVQLRQELDDAEQRLRACEAELDALMAGEETFSEVISSTLLSRTSPFTRKVLHILRDHPGSPVSYLVEHVGGPDDGKLVKRIHNSLRTLARQGLAERVGRGRWQAIELEDDTSCHVCETRYSSILGVCPGCNTAPGHHHNGEGS